MVKIDLQSKAIARTGKIEIYWFENIHVGIPKTMFHRIYIPLLPFDSGLEYESQPIETEIVIEWLNLGLNDPTDIDGVKLSSTPEDETEVSIYVGHAHNLCEVKRGLIKRIEGKRYEIECELLVEFENENVAMNELFEFVAHLELDEQIKH